MRTFKKTKTKNFLMKEKFKIIVLDYLRRQHGDNFMDNVVIETPVTPYDLISYNGINTLIKYKGKKIAYCYLDNSLNLQINYMECYELYKYTEDIFVIVNFMGEHDIDKMFSDIIKEKLSEKCEDSLIQQQILDDNTQDIYFLENNFIFADTSIDRKGVSTLTIYK